MFEPTEREVDQDVQKSIDMFERALVPGSATLTPRAPRSILVALDGSTQDDMSLTIAQRLAQRFQSSIAVIDARQGVDDGGLAEAAAQRLAATPLPRRSGDAFDQILSAIDETSCDLAIVPSPFGRNIEKVGADSTGTVIDVLLARSPVPVLVVRNPYELAAQPFARVILAFAAENEAAVAATNWAVELAAGGGELQLMLIVDDEAVENTRALMQAMHKEVQFTADEFGEALQRSFLPLHKSLLAVTREKSLKYRLDVRHERHFPIEEITADQRHPLLVLGLERADRQSQGYVHDQIRFSENAVLVVPFPERSPQGRPAG